MDKIVLFADDKAKFNAGGFENVKYCLDDGIFYFKGDLIKWGFTFTTELTDEKKLARIEDEFIETKKAFIWFGKKYKCISSGKSYRYKKRKPTSIVTNNFTIYYRKDEEMK